MVCTTQGKRTTVTAPKVKYVWDPLLLAGSLTG